MLRALALWGLLLGAGPGALGWAAEVPTVLFILDASGSMWGRVGGEEKIVAARRVMEEEVAKKLDPSWPIGLMAYGHNRKDDCNDIEMVAPVGTDRQAVLAAVNRLMPKGMTPITTALTRAGEALRTHEGRAEIVLVSDGIETCEGDPCAAAKAVRESGVALRIHVIGFDVDTKAETA